LVTPTEEKKGGTKEEKRCPGPFSNLTARDGEKIRKKRGEKKRASTVAEPCSLDGQERKRVKRKKETLALIRASVTRKKGDKETAKKKKKKRELTRTQSHPPSSSSHKKEGRGVKKKGGEEGVVVPFLRIKKGGKRKRGPKEERKKKSAHSIFL